MRSVLLFLLATVAGGAQAAAAQPTPCPSLPADVAAMIRQSVVKAAVHGEKARTCEMQAASSWAQLLDVRSRLVDAKNKLAQIARRHEETKAALQRAGRTPEGQGLSKDLQLILEQGKETEALRKQLAEHESALGVAIARQRECVKDELAALDSML